MIYDVDADTLIDLQRGDQAAREAMRRVVEGPNTSRVSVVVVAEYYSGCDVGDWPDVDAVIDALERLPVTLDIAIESGRYRREATRRGRTLHLPDALIAATARLGGATLLTRNTRDFALTDVSVVTPAEVIARR